MNTQSFPSTIFTYTSVCYEYTVLFPHNLYKDISVFHEYKGRLLTFFNFSFVSSNILGSGVGSSNISVRGDCSSKFIHLPGDLSIFVSVVVSGGCRKSENIFYKSFTRSSRLLRLFISLILPMRFFLKSFYNIML